MCKERITLAKNKLKKFVGKEVRLRIGDHGALNKVHISAVDDDKVFVVFSNSENDIPAIYDLSLVREISEV